MFGVSPMLTINKNIKVESIFGGFATLIIYSLIIVVIWNEILNFIENRTYSFDNKLIRY